VTYVVDGDTVKVRPSGGGKPVSVRISGIDAPEICQAGGTASRDALMRKVLGQHVAVHGRHHDDYGRLLAKITFKGEDAGRWMVAQGQAWSYRNRANAGPYAAQQRRAKAAGLGIFSPSQAAPAVYPAQFRKRHGSCY
jgi:micrococcal nuclease